MSCKTRCDNLLIKEVGFVATYFLQRSSKTHKSTIQSKEQSYNFHDYRFSRSRDTFFTQKQPVKHAAAFTTRSTYMSGDTVTRPLRNLSWIT